MSASPTKACPICGKPATDKFRPFCSARCADIDLNRWLSGAYVIPADAGRADAEGDEPGAPLIPGSDEDDNI